MRLLLWLMVVTNVAWAQFQYSITIDDTHDVVMRWNITATNVIVQIQAPVSGYVAIGWSKAGKMRDSFAAISLGSPATELVLTSDDASGVNVAPDQTLQNVSVVTSAGVTTMTFTRPISHATRPIPVNQDTYMIWAVHPSAKAFVQHTYYGSLIVNLSTGAFRLGSASLVIAHGLMMFVAFTIAFPLGVLWAKHRSKGNPDRIPRHKQLQFLGGIMALVAFVLVVVERGSGTHFNYIHSVLGLIMIIIMMSQFAVAFVRPEFGSPWRKYWDMFHFYVGRLIFVAGPVTCLLGAGLYMKLFANDLEFLFWLVIIVTVLIWGATIALHFRQESPPDRHVATESR